MAFLYLNIYSYINTYHIKTITPASPITPSPPHMRHHKNNHQHNPATGTMNLSYLHWLTTIYINTYMCYLMFGYSVSVYTS